MKNICLYFGMFLLIDLAGCSFENGVKQQDPTSLLLEDCEDGDNLTLQGGRWYIATDSEKGAASTISISKGVNGVMQLTGEGFQSKTSFMMSYHLKKDTYSFKPFVICGFKVQSAEYESFDASQYEGISYYFKGPAHSVRVETAVVTDFCYHSFSVPASGEWTKVEVPFSKLKQEFWGEEVPFDVHQVKGISWQIPGSNGDSSSIMFDNISLEELIETIDSASISDCTIEGVGITMQGTFYKAQGNGPFPLIVVLPGGTSASDIGTVYTHHHNFGKLFSSKGICVLVLDYSSDQRIFFDTLQINDIGNAIEYCKKLSTVDTNNIFLNGFSIGGANALRVAGSRTDIAGVVCYFSPCDWRVSGGGAGVKKQPIDYCPSIKCPVLILQGDSDMVTAPSQSILLNDTLKSMGKKCELVIFKGAAHGFTYEGAPVGRCIYNREIAEESYRKVEAFLMANTSD